jgi:antitoxin component of MazEF toxin-antitoxin module
MKTRVKIRKIKGKYILILPNFLIYKTGLEEGSMLAVHVDENTINITNMDNEHSTLPDTIEENVDIYSKILDEENLILAK